MGIIASNQLEWEDRQIPTELSNANQWVVWRYETRNGKPTKVPYAIQGHKASVTDPSTWSTFQEVLAAAPQFSGIGFVLTKEDPFTFVDLDKTDLALCKYAMVLTLKPGEISEPDHINNLKDAGIEERTLLDAALVIAYFNFLNRMVMGLGVQLEKDGGKGYEYD